MRTTYFGAIIYIIIIWKNHIPHAKNKLLNIVWNIKNISYLII